MKITTETPIPEGLLDTINPTLRFKDYASLKEQADMLTVQFQEQGFIECQLQQLAKRNDTLFETIYSLGNRWKEIEIAYSKEHFSKEKIARISKNVTDNHFTIPIPQVSAALSYLNQESTKKGNSFATLQLINIKVENTSLLTAELSIDYGAVRTLDKIVIKGYDKFPVSFLRYYAGIKKERVFNQQRVINQNEILNNLGFVSTLRPPEALFRSDSTTVYFYLEKQNNNLFDGILGFATNEATQKLEFNGYLNLELNNNLNFGEQLLINFKSDGRDQQNFRVKTSLPYLFRTPVGAELELKIFKRDSTFATTDQQARLNYQANPNTSVYAGYKSYESSNLLDEAVAGQTVEDFNSNYVLFGATYTKPQTKNLFPIKTYIGLSTELGNRETSDTKEDQFRITTTISHIFNFNDRNSFYLNNESNLLSSETYLTNELFRFGGINSIRGFSENSIDASIFSVLNTEYRYLFNQSTYIHSIIDLAYFENQTLNLKEELYSFGIGLGLQTEAGIFKFNIANGVSQEQNFKFSNTKIHISLSSRF